jgi:Fic family protein
MSDIAIAMGIPMGTVSCWSSKADRMGRMTGKEKFNERYTSKEKQKILWEVSELSDEELGAYLRKKGISEAQLKQWQAAVDAVLDTPKKQQRQNKMKERAYQKEIRQLKRELRRKEKALAETAAILVLKKKLEAFYAEEDKDTEKPND